VKRPNDVVLFIVVVVVVGLDGAGNEGLGIFLKGVLHSKFFQNGCLAVEHISLNIKKQMSIAHQQMHKFYIIY
jgi:hypothetical protein